MKDRAQPAIDPTENVKALNEAAAKRQDDLRLYSERLMDAKIESLKEIVSLHAKHAAELADAEAKRLDAIRLVDVNAVSIASERAAAAALALATQVSQSAEALRTLVHTTAETALKAQTALIAALSERLTKLEQGSYQQAGGQNTRSSDRILIFGIIAAIAALVGIYAAFGK